MCSCNQTETVIDIHTGDTICTNCGCCKNDIIVDNNGNLPPDPKNTVTNYDVVLKDNFSSLTKLLGKLMYKYSVNHALQEHGYAIISHMEKEGFELRGNKHENVCIAIIYNIHKHFDIFWNIEDICKHNGIRQAKVKKLANAIHTDKNNSSSSQLHKHIMNVASTLNISVNLKSQYIGHIQNMSRSTKMKTAVFLYTQDDTKLNKICSALSIQKNQILGCYSELKSLCRNNP